MKDKLSEIERKNELFIAYKLKVLNKMKLKTQNLKILMKYISDDLENL